MIGNENRIDKPFLRYYITGIGMFFREFAEAVLQRFDYDVENNFMRYKPEYYTKEELTF